MDLSVFFNPGQAGAYRLEYRCAVVWKFPSVSDSERARDDTDEYWINKALCHCFRWSWAHWLWRALRLSSGQIIRDALYFFKLYSVMHNICQEIWVMPAHRKPWPKALWFPFVSPFLLDVLLCPVIHNGYTYSLTLLLKSQTLFNIFLFGK